MYNQPTRGIGFNPREGGCLMSDVLVEVYQTHSRFVCRTFLFSNLMLFDETSKSRQRFGQVANELSYCTISIFSQLTFNTP